MKYWGGGVVCAEMSWKNHAQAVAAGVAPIPGPTCFNGEVAKSFGSPEFIGLGFSVMVMLVIIEIFGSTFMRNCNVIIALLFGYVHEAGLGWVMVMVMLLPDCLGVYMVVLCFVLFCFGLLNSPGVFCSCVCVSFFPFLCFQFVCPL